MSYIAKKGKAAAESATTEKKDFSKAIVSLKSGTTLKVRIPSVHESAEVYMHSVYKVFYSTPCTPGDLYCKAVDLLYQDAKAAKSEDEAEEIRQQAYQIKGKPRYLFGFFNLENGEPVIIDLSKKQAQVIYAAANKYEKKLDKLAFEISKTGTGTGTTVSIAPVIDMDDDLTDTERKNFDATAGKEIDEEIYENCLYVKGEAEQIEDLTKFGFDVSRLGVSGGDEVKPIEDGPGEEPDYGF